MTIDRVSWGYRQNAKLEDFLTVAEIVKGLQKFVEVLHFAMQSTSYSLILYLSRIGHNR